MEGNPSGLELALENPILSWEFPSIKQKSRFLF